MVKNRKRIGAFIVGSAMILTTMLPSGISSAASAGQVNVTIDTGAERASISPYIYGGNWEFNNAKLTANRLGGNRMTGYNWENNFSNAGSDWQHSSDTFAVSNAKIPEAQWDVPGIVASDFHEKNQAAGEAYSLVTLQAAGYVSADGNGTVAEEDAAPSDRWKEVKFTKDAPLSTTPDTTDDYIYMDEYVNFLVNKYGNASSATGVKGYAIDNEPALWVGTHPRIHPEKPACAEIIDKNIELAKAVKKVDPFAETFGLVAYGFSEYNTFQDAPDWDSLKGNYNWFLDYYLDSMKKASDAEGKRLIDVLDLHWYPEARGGGERITFGGDISNTECNKARLQAPRTLWDSTYMEDSWIATYCSDKLPLLPNIKTSIDTYNPGTKLGFTEYSFGGDEHITGGIAQADALGVFGKYGVYFASVWGGGSYTASGFNIYTNYDGNGSAYGDTKVKAETSDAENSSVYASVDEKDASKLHVILINKNYDSPMTVNFDIAGDKSYKSGRVWAFDRGSSNIYEKAPIENINNNKLLYTVPALTVCHIVLDTNGGTYQYGDFNKDGNIDSIDMAGFKMALLTPGTVFDKKMDLNGDAAVDSIDYAILKQYLLRIITSLEPEQTENNAPTAAFTVSPKEAYTGDDIAFDASASSDPDGKVYIYSWNFGDKTEGSGKTVTHKYKTPGTYTAKLTVTDELGLSGSVTDTVTITTATGDNSDINFEDGTTQGVGTNDAAVSQVAVTADKAFKGAHSLEWNVTCNTKGLADIVVNSDEPVLTPGKSMTFRVWIPEGAPIKTIQPFVMPHDATWGTIEWNSSWASYEQVKKGDWNEFTVTLSPTSNTDLVQQQFGIQIQTLEEGNFTVYVDSIDW
ncbi:dockerin type I repeat protein [Ruminiclostridium sufflavum DSM 19573]|uniref:cellulase n=1 Tax=Ruminiclostridium sufflavum DSM 19573 TaxID=1121337 RepID=A0A318XKB0_9FIRM|nr:glycoside hydrolase family 44 protein [Ruminiclostridium sufflavum]PYG86898.1 dockerin type I repeat protein [Ruminiclostridium sufflavum DSM 19573]